MGSAFSQYAWLIPLFPLLSFLLLTAAGRSLREAGTYISIAAVFVSFVLAVLIFFERIGGGVEDYTWNNMEWLKLGDFTLKMGFEVTNLNALMLVIVTLVSLLVNIYSKGYMHGDERIHVFFAYIALFTFSMLGLVISVNLVQLYIFWELVGVCSFLLVGFWYFKPEAREAAKKAFIVTRVGDVGLFIGILLLFWVMPDHALDFTSISNAFEGGKISGEMATWIAILIFIGAMGKSGQFPLHTWLPDAMEGPTPISALIHAATMVAAGVYLVARTFDIFTAAPAALTVVAVVGAFTALFAATIGTAQNDIKRILAYSTVSQLGYMMMALGIGTTAAYTAGIFHLFTHAFFKALLFLGAGSVIHAVHTQNIHEMGGVGSKMKITAWTFAIGALALSGIVPLSGFWSKDAILTEAYNTGHYGLMIVGLIAAFFTAFYMSRLYFLVFFGKPRGEHAGHMHESPSSMTMPLVVLAVLAVVAGFVFTPFAPWLGTWLTGHAEAEHASVLVMVLSTLVGLLGIGAGYLVYVKRTISAEGFVAAAPWLYKLLNRKYFIDELYQVVWVRSLQSLGQLLHLFDVYVVDGAVRLTSYAVTGVGRLGSRLQNGQVQTYGLATLIGLLILMLAIAGRRFINLG
ncbi:NADH-quinone oxidoreductase subunit L [Paenibacillus sp. UNCCL117]|uniref:NADH-quinone oxidoreductase subunit L n=1 Tax=unclassified Paenibacillus TaxID=185978 RepID=UPI000887B262|nr:MULTISPECIES: NADH-quinone oxidoreductase subunit L [unclassified Paenibacillus]SDE34217.1 NADH-quinone oxidoreductase subunit L [Paenibacillus sp. cl123]SFW64216.1 NADH-quinone oxidoreductase subunit L [Paenibacillus sp. UNCCL117]